MSNKTFARQALFQLHLYAGLIFGAILAVAGLTGSALVFKEEIESSVHAEMAVVTPGERRIPLEQLLQVVRRNYPQHEVTWLTLKNPPDQALQFITRTTDERTRQPTRYYAYVNQYTGEGLGVRSRDRDASWMNWIADLHYNLLTGETGHIVNGVAAIILILLCVSGIRIWFTGWRHLRRGFVIKRNANWKRFNYDLHRVTGIFALLLLTAVAVSALYFVFKKEFEQTINLITFSSAKPQPPRSIVRENVVPPTLDELVARAEAALPGSSVAGVVFPSQPDKAFDLWLRLPGDWYEWGSNHVYFDSYSGEVLRVDDGRRASLGTRIMNFMPPLHFGTFGGVWTRALWVLLGLAPATLFFSGFLMWWNRVVARRLKRLRLTSAEFNNQRSAAATSVNS